VLSRKNKRKPPKSTASFKIKNKPSMQIREIPSDSEDSELEASDCEDEAESMCVGLPGRFKVTRKLPIPISIVHRKRKQEISLSGKMNLYRVVAVQIALYSTQDRPQKPIWVLVRDIEKFLGISL
jgi:hypothetical protein